MKLILVDMNKEVCDAFQKYFGDYDNVEIHNCSFQELDSYDCIVSAANSFGIMNGGLDKHLRNYFGFQLQKRVQEYIFENFKGEQPVGSSFIISTGHEKHPYLAHTPTMRVPMKINGTDNVYRAMKSLLIEIERFNKENNDVIQSVACTGLGTLVGGMIPDKAIQQMLLAYKHYLNPVKMNNWIEACNYHEQIESLL